MTRSNLLTPLRVIALGFFILILIGAALLMLPLASAGGKSAPFSVALFTSVSASCVTGLVLTDTGTYWSRFGQTVILLLIQTGGLGFVTIVSTSFWTVKKRIGLRERELLSESMSAARVEGVLRVARLAVRGTLLLEGAGVVLLSIRFIPRFGVGEGIYYAVFHAISAFCNAGFDLMGVIEPFSSFDFFAGDAPVCLTLAALIFSGGIGFFVWDDIRQNGLRFKRYRLHTKLVLSASGILTLAGMAILYFCEQNGLPQGTRLLCAFFGSVTARTAGFNTVGTSALSGAGKLVTMLLMLVGGSPASTAGGIKTTTAAVLVLYAAAGYSGQKHLNAFGRSVNDDTLKKAVLVALTNFSLAFLGALVLLISQPLRIEDVLFETFSAIGTVGMSTGITRKLNAVSRAVVMTLMYLGRVGSMSFALALMEKRVRPDVMQPAEHVTIG